MLRVYGEVFSGNCYKVKLLLNQLDLKHEWIPVDLLRHETRTPEFLAKNPNGKVPVLELTNGLFLAESNAIIHYLADGTPLLPHGRFQHAQVLQWLFFEQYSHEPYIATSRFIIRSLGRPADQEALLQSKVAPGYRALDVMEKHLSTHHFFVADRYTIADIALYAYTHVAHEGGFDLDNHPKIRTWLQRIRDQVGYIGMDG
ncbi:MAG: glutathione S-transferase family protein [Steroidobacteraceae bacterium]